MIRTVLTLNLKFSKKSENKHNQIHFNTQKFIHHLKNSFACNNILLRKFYGFGMPETIQDTLLNTKRRRKCQN